ncbi:AbrB family transcriptional regulator [Bacillus sp. FJAT-44742]|uniref:AbrB family transcriptional regulator n=1 Tax=Bacillus sp. FJAT-44742 TaxID=2014005 RepID=UPI000C248363|nr:AbrB family transcriptional regulator [Bacillus sp. FJAT-44742]
MKGNAKLIGIGIAGGLVGYVTGFPIGALLGTLFAIATFNMITGAFHPLQLKTKRLIQVFIGSSIGLSFTEDTFLLFGELLFSSIILSVSTILISTLLAILSMKLLNYDAATAFSSLAPAGMSEMLLIAESHGADIPVTATIHLFRIVTIITTIPVITYLLV